VATKWPRGSDGSTVAAVCGDDNSRPPVLDTPIRFGVKMLWLDIRLGFGERMKPRRWWQASEQQTSAESEAVVLVDVDADTIRGHPPSTAGAIK